MATISHFVFNVWVVLMSEINSEAMFCLMFKSDLLFALYLEIALELQISMEIQDGHHQPFCFQFIGSFEVRNQFRSHVLSEIDLLFALL